MTATALTHMLTGHIGVRVDRRTPDGGLEPVASGRLVDGDRAGNTLQILNHRRELVTVRLSAAHVVAYTPRHAAEEATR